MAETQHTPEPGDWEVGPLAPSPATHFICGDTPTIVFRGSGALVATLACGWDKAEIQAFARLIAASPIMLEALKACATILETVLLPENDQELRDTVAAAWGNAEQAIDAATKGA